MDWLSLFSLAMLIAIAYMQLIQGLISSLIMCVLTVLCAVLAFATYEWVGYSFLMGPLGDLALPAALIATFVLPLIGLRFAVDAMISRSNLLPILIDRAAGSIAAAVTGLTMTGMLALAVQMVPFGGTFLGHTGVDPDTGEMQSLWLGPDRFAAGLAASMSDGLFSGEQIWSERHPDFVQEIAWSQAADRATRHVVPPGSIRVVSTEESVPYVFKKTKKDARSTPKYDRMEIPDGKRWYKVRVALEEGAKDEDGPNRFSRWQVRLVGRDHADARPANYPLLAITDDDDPTAPVIIEDGALYKPASGNEVDFVFEVPETFQPSFIEYKVGARADLSGRAPAADTATPETETETPDAASPPADTTASEPTAPSSGRRGGRVSGVRGRIGGHKFSDALPVKMTNYQQTGLEGRGNLMSSGHIYGRTADQEEGSSREVSKFDVPSDKRLFQLDVERLQAGSTLGKALQFAVTSLKDYQLHDESGKRYPVVGQFAIADVDGSEVVEVQYYPEAVAATNRGGLREFRLIKKRHLKGRKYKLVYLFLVDPGAKLTEFTTGAGRHPTDLTKFNLTAPR
jgi:hypothetical protein